jgi:hypothetical protein
MTRGTASLPVLRDYYTIGTHARSNFGDSSYHIFLLEMVYCNLPLQSSPVEAEILQVSFVREITPFKFSFAKDGTRGKDYSPSLSNWRSCHFNCTPPMISLLAPPTISVDQLLGDLNSSEQEDRVPF